MLVNILNCVCLEEGIVLVCGFVFDMIVCDVIMGFFVGVVW